MAACGAETAPSGGLMLILGEDGPLALDRMHITVAADGAVLHDVDYRIPAEASLPTTLAVASNGRAGARVTVSVSGYRGGAPVDRRDNLVEQVPTDRVASLRIVLSGRCTPQVSAEADGGARSRCADGETCEPKSGACVGGRIDASALPTFDPSAPLPTSGAPPATCDGGPCEACPAAHKRCAERCVSLTDPAFGCGAATCEACPASSTCAGPAAAMACACVDDGKACAGKNCGDVTNNCGAKVSCGTCTASATCGVNEPNRCGYAQSCVIANQTTTGCRGNSEGCCESLLVPAATYDRRNNVATPATVSAFRLDKYEVTVGRFRTFVDAALVGWRPPPGSGKHVHLDGGAGLKGEPGWLASYDVYLPTDASTFAGEVVGARIAPTWTLTPGANERLPMVYMHWYEAYAFCIWDHGFLPTEAEWQLAATGGAEQRVYPWGNTLPSASFANWCVAGASCVGPSTAPGAFTPGDGRFGHADLAGNAWEWVLDGWSGVQPTSPCNDCYLSYQFHAYGAGFDTASTGGLANAQSRLDTSSGTLRSSFPIGVRCARAP